MCDDKSLKSILLFEEQIDYTPWYNSFPLCIMMIRWSQRLHAGARPPRSWVCPLWRVSVASPVLLGLQSRNVGVMQMEYVRYSLVMGCIGTVQVAFHDPLAPLTRNPLVFNGLKSDRSLGLGLNQRMHDSRLFDIPIFQKGATRSWDLR